MTLRLVHPAPPGQPPRLSKRRRSAALSLAPEEVRHLRASLRNLVRAYGTWACLAEVVGVRVDTLKQAINARRRPSGVLAIRVVKAAGMGVEALLSGQLGAAGRCEACGARVGAREGAVTFAEQLRAAHRALAWNVVEGRRAQRLTIREGPAGCPRRKALLTSRRHGHIWP